MIFTSDTWPTNRWPNFSFGEMRCKQTGECDMDPEFMDALQEARTIDEHPWDISSGFRSKLHSDEAGKSAPGSHTYGLAVDIKCSGERAYDIARLVFMGGFTGIGFSQKGDHGERFLHLDKAIHVPRPAIWSY